MGGLCIRDATEHDLVRVLALNQAALPAVSSLTAAGLHELAIVQAAYFRVVERERRADAFLIGLLPGASYESENYAWFSRRYERFLYVDRIVVADDARSRGIGAALYRDLEAFGAGRVPRICCEVNLRPPNPSSLRFHEREGFARVGTQETDGGKKEVALLVRPQTLPPDEHEPADD